jgi:hypothetical protein
MGQRLPAALCRRHRSDRLRFLRHFRQTTLEPRTERFLEGLRPHLMGRALLVGDGPLADMSIQQLPRSHKESLRHAPEYLSRNRCTPPGPCEINGR